MTRFQLVLTAFFAASFGSPQSVIAQSSGGWRGLEGMKVRISAALLEQDDRAGTMAIQGTVFEIRDDSIYLLQAGGKGLRLPLSSVRTVQVHGGKDHGRGAYLGAVAGAAFGALIAISTPIECNGDGYGVDCRNDGSRPTYAEYVGSYAGTLAVLGAFIGAVRGVERWETVLTQRLTISPAPRRGAGLRVGLSF